MRQGLKCAGYPSDLARFDMVFIFNVPKITQGVSLAMIHWWVELRDFNMCLSCYVSLQTQLVICNQGLLSSVTNVNP